MVRSEMRLNLGCGNHPPTTGWVNVDYAFGARCAKIPGFNRLNRVLHIFTYEWDRHIVLHDLRKPFPWGDQTISAIYSSHTLEHFSRVEGRAFLQECHRVLAPKGLLRLLVPDLQCIVTQYLRQELRADEFIERLMVQYISEQDGPLKRLFAYWLRSPHKCLYDTPTLFALTQAIGFDVRCKAPFESEIDDIQQIEAPDRTVGVVILEGRKR